MHIFQITRTRGRRRRSRVLHSSSVSGSVRKRKGKRGVSYDCYLGHCCKANFAKFSLVTSHLGKLIGNRLFFFGKMIVRITGCLYHARSSHQSLRTSSFYNTAISKEKARTFCVSLSLMLSFVLLLCSKISS